MKYATQIQNALDFCAIDAMVENVPADKTVFVGKVVRATVISDFVRFSVAENIIEWHGGVPFLQFKDIIDVPLADKSGKLISIPIQLLVKRRLSAYADVEQDGYAADYLRKAPQNAE